MVFTDWTYSGDGTGKLDAVTKYAGNSSYKTTLIGTYQSSSLTHNTFLEPQAQIIVWILTNEITKYSRIGHSSYGSLRCIGTANNTWDRHRTTFWYDITNNIRWGRVERWNGTQWVQIGTDTNCGVDSPAAGTISLNFASQHISGTDYCWFDEVEVYS